MTHHEPILELKGIRKTFGEVEALKGVDLAIEKGEFFGFLGPNGAGKSTLMKVLSSFLKPDAGTVTIKGQHVSYLDYQARRSCGLVPQEIALYDSLNPLENMQVFGKLYGIVGKDLEKRAGTLLEAVGLSDRRRDRVKEFSGGMKRRLNIAVSLLHEPDILLCDEPTVGVDPQSRNAIFTFLEELNREGLTVLYTTHYMEEAERLCPRIAIIDHGSILACGEQEALMRQSKSGREVVIKKAAGIEGLLEWAGRHGTLIENDLSHRFIPDEGMRVSTLYGILEENSLSDDLITVRKPSLESLFLQLTGHRLRE